MFNDAVRLTRPALPRSSVRRAHHWLACCGRIDDEGAAVAIARSDETGGHVIAEKCNIRGVRAVADRERAASVAVVRSMGEACVVTVGNTCEIEQILRANGTGEATAKQAMSEIKTQMDGLLKQGVEEDK